MPELPEVETIRRQLGPAITGLRFAHVWATEPSMLRDCTDDEVRTLLLGRFVEGVDRLGKFLIVRLSGPGGYQLTLHLGMTGQLLVGPMSPKVGAHTRFLFALGGLGSTPACLEFRDIRKFGRLHLTAHGPAPRLASLGPDAWDGAWNVVYLADRLRGRKTPIKAFLLDQRNLAGIGNIYADEILWWCGIAPMRPAGSISSEETQRLADEIRARLGEGIRRLGCTLSDFVDTKGNEGGFQDYLQAYGRYGQKCGRCGERLVRAVIGGRGTSYCPGCQR
jgi:formamidopyrimidine-DNA glycosylase